MIVRLSNTSQILLFKAVLLVGLVLGSPTQAEVQTPLRIMTTKVAPDTYIIDVQVHHGWRFNERAPEERRLVFRLEHSDIWITGTEFISDQNHARLTFQAETNLSGELEALLCQPELCRRVRVPVSWTSHKE